MTKPNTTSSCALQFNPDSIPSRINPNYSNMNLLEFTDPSTKPMWHRFGKATALAIAVASVIAPMAQATNIDTNSLTIAPNGKLDLGTSPANTAGVLATTRNAVIVRASSAAAQATNVTNIRTWVNRDMPGDFGRKRYHKRNGSK